MFTRQLTPINAKLDEAITSVLDALNAEDPESDKYERISAQLEKLYKIKNETHSRRVSPDTLANILANLAGIGIIVGYEQKHILTSKAVGFIKKLF